MKNILDKTMKWIFITCGFFTIAVVLIITGFLLVNGLPGIREVGFFNFIFGNTWRSTGDNPQFGILPLLLSSIFGTFAAILVGVPIALFTAIFLSKVAGRRTGGVVNTVVELLAGIPSMVYGFIGLIVLVPFVRTTFNLNHGATLLSAIVVLAIMILPIVINVSRMALDAVPKKYEEASYALGATKMETIFKVCIPTAKSGIAAGVVLGIGRAIGEAMAVMMVAGNVANMPNLFSPVTFLTTAIASELRYAAGGSLHRNALFSIGLVLFVFILIINLTLNFALKRGTKV